MREQVENFLNKNGEIYLIIRQGGHYLSLTYSVSTNKMTLGYSGEGPSITNFMDKNSFLNEVSATPNVSSVFMYGEENEYLSKWNDIKRDVDYFVYQSELKSAAKSAVFGLLCGFAAYTLIEKNEDNKYRNPLIGLAGISGATVYYRLATFRPG